MEEIENLIKLINSLPTLALWVLIGFWAYKVIIVGSIYGLIRFIVAKVHDVMIQRKTKVVDVRPMLDDLTINNALDPLIEEIKRLRLARGDSTGIYIHKSGVEFLREALDDKFAKEAEKKAAKKAA